MAEAAAAEAAEAVAVAEAVAEAVGEAVEHFRYPDTPLLHKQRSF